MARDNSISKMEEGFVFENRNIRLSSSGHDTLMSATNERGNRKIEGLSFSGTLIGWNVLDKYIILFTKDSINDHIYRVECGDSFKSVEIFKGKLGFSLDYPIESVVDHETEDIMKIYWVDGKNPLRYLNFSDKYLSDHLSSGSLYRNPVFNFAGNVKWFDTNRQPSKKDLKVSIDKDWSGNTRANGTIQYYMTMYTKNGNETSFVYVSPLVYLSPDDRGGSADGHNTCRTKLTIDKSSIDTTFDYIRTYAIVRTSEDGQPSCYIVSENAINGNDVVVVDSGNYLSAYDASALLFIGSREVVASTMTHKDNTLFLGGLESVGNDGVDVLSKSVKDSCFASNKWESAVISYEISNDLPFDEDTGFYSYDCQLKYPMDRIAGFKGGEKYRFALQFRKDNGTLSKAFWIGDKVNGLYPRIASGRIGRPIVRCKIPSSVMDTASRYGFTSVRLMMAKANYSDRSVLAQGIVNPTMFNMLDRSLNAPYAIPSWITRPKGGRIPFAHLCGLERSDSPYGEIQCNWWEDGMQPSPFRSTYTPPAASTPPAGSTTKVEYNALFDFNAYMDDGGNVKGVYGTVTVSFYKTGTKKLITKLSSRVPDESISYIPSSQAFYYALHNLWGTVWELRFSLPNVSSKIFSETMSNGSSRSYISGTCKLSELGNYTPSDDDIEDVIDETYEESQRDCFYIDESIVTLNSPEIEYENVNIDRNSGLKFRIVGVADVSSVIADYDMEVSNQRMAKDGVIKTSFSSVGDNARMPGIVAAPVYSDFGIKYNSKDLIFGDSDDELDDKYREFSGETRYYMMNMWHKGGSIVNFRSTADSDYGENTWAMLDRKVFANLHFCKHTVFNDYKSNVWDKQIDDVRQCTGYNQQMYELKHDGGRCMYVSNIDKVIARTKSYPVLSSSVAPSAGSVPVLENSKSSHDPVSMRYRSSAHAVISLKNTGSSLTILPYLFTDSSYGVMNKYNKSEVLFGWKGDDGEYHEPSQSSYSVSGSVFRPSTNYLFIGELYNDYDSNPSSDTRYGGTSESAVEANVFIPCSEFDAVVNASVVGIVGKRGDTFFQRWDCVKTMPMGDSDSNSVIDIVSAMLETHINIDGRTDIDRGTSKLASMDIANFGSLNRAYSQSDNFISAFNLDDGFDFDSYPSTLTWTLEKHPADEIDEWTHITLASTLKLDGDKGRLRALRRFSNTIVAFQDRGISEVMFNSRVQLNTNDGAPVELANSGKVDGKRYISEKSGCVNKWSIVEGKNGIYFIDDINRNISLFNGQGLENLSTGNRFDAWLNDRLGSVKTESWTPASGSGQFISHYDKVNSEVYFYKWDDESYPCLVYSEPFGAFTSFYDYRNVPMMANVGRRFVSFRNNALWLQNDGFYGSFFGEDYPFSVVYRVAPDAYTDKLWTNLEYRSDFFEVLDDSGKPVTGESLVDGSDLESSLYRSGITFDTVNVWNEHQKTGDVAVSGNGTVDSYPDARSKFRIWRMDIPRDATSASNPLIQNRIRNPWIYLKLQKNSDDIRKMVVHLHDVIVKYFTTE